MQSGQYRIRVPATSANIGPGFDALGLSLSLYLSLAVSPAASLSLAYTGCGASKAPLDPSINLITRVALYVLRCHGIPSLPPVHIQIHNDIPFGRGLGSSGAAVIAGVLLADILGSLSLSRDKQLDYALMIERHPDNVAAALYGGFIGSYLNNTPPSSSESCLTDLAPARPTEAMAKSIRFGPWVKHLKAVVCIPRFEVPTSAARSVLPTKYDRKDIVHNIQRAAMLTTALVREPLDRSLILDLMSDTLHQPYRASLIPALPEMLSSLRKHHPCLLGICLSGAGPTILALAVRTSDQDSAIPELGDAMCAIWNSMDIKSTWLELDVEETGAVVEELDNADGIQIKKVGDVQDRLRMVA